MPSGIPLGGLQSGPDAHLDGDSGGPRALLDPLSTVDTDWKRDDRRRRMFQVLSSEWSTTSVLVGEQIVPIVWSESYIIGDQLSPRRKKKKKVSTRQTTRKIPCHSLSITSLLW